MTPSRTRGLNYTWFPAFRYRTRGPRVPSRPWTWHDPAVTLPTSGVSAVSPAELTDSLRHRGEGAFRMSVRGNLRLAAKSDPTWLDQPAATSSPIPDHVLLCCFGSELAGSRHRRHLCAALQKAGYRGPLAQHLIRVSPLLIGETGRRYRLKRCDEPRS